MDRYVVMYGPGTDVRTFRLEYGPSTYARATEHFNRMGGRERGYRMWSEATWRNWRDIVRSGRGAARRRAPVHHHRHGR